MLIEATPDLPAPILKTFGEFTPVCQQEKDAEELREIAYGELADWLKQLYDVASTMCALDITVGASPNSLPEPPKVSTVAHLTRRGSAG